MTDNLGIVFRNGRLLWGYRHGYAQRWPMWAKEAIVGGYNWIVCRLTQHDDHEWHLAENGLNWDDPGGVCSLWSRRTRLHRMGVLA